VRLSASRAGLPPPEEAPALSLPADDRLRRDERQVLAPAGTQAVCQDPEQLVPRAKASTRPGPSRTGQHRRSSRFSSTRSWRERAQAEDGREEGPDEVEHSLSIADLHSSEVLPPHSPFATASQKRGQSTARSLVVDSMAKVWLPQPNPAPTALDAFLVSTFDAINDQDCREDYPEELRNLMVISLVLYLWLRRSGACDAICKAVWGPSELATYGREVPDMMKVKQFVATRQIGAAM
jgi:hypothetical protein